MTNCMQLLYCVTLRLSSIRCIERLFCDEKVLNAILVVCKEPEKKSMLGGLFNKNDAKKDAVKASVRLLTLWTDVTMVYQGEFIEMWDCWKQLRSLKSGPITMQSDAEHDFDGVRLMMHNLERQFVDVPILSMNDNFNGEKDWAMATRSNEAASAFACSYVMRDMLQRQENPDAEKLTFMYHYLMNFRSRYGRELRVKVRRKTITENQHGDGNSELSQISDSLKEAKCLMEQK